MRSPPTRTPRWILPDAHGLQVHLGRGEGIERWAEDGHLQAYLHLRKGALDEMGTHLVCWFMPHLFVIYRICQSEIEDIILYIFIYYILYVLHIFPFKDGGLTSPAIKPDIEAIAGDHRFRLLHHCSRLQLRTLPQVQDLEETPMEHVPEKKLKPNRFWHSDEKQTLGTQM